jgi:hypothetical protein
VAALAAIPEIEKSFSGAEYRGRMSHHSARRKAVTRAAADRIMEVEPFADQALRDATAGVSSPSTIWASLV